MSRDGIDSDGLDSDDVGSKHLRSGDSLTSANNRLSIRSFQRHFTRSAYNEKVVFGIARFPIDSGVTDSGVAAEPVVAVIHELRDAIESKFFFGSAPISLHRLAVQF